MPQVPAQSEEVEEMIPPKPPRSHFNALDFICAILLLFMLVGMLLSAAALAFSLRCAWVAAAGA